MINEEKVNEALRAASDNGHVEVVKLLKEAMQTTHMITIDGKDVEISHESFENLKKGLK